ncbi:hypothetical protein RM572_26530 [Streptomyces sp. DSM 42041]|uniref:Uncharacterized protein n=1 Tax=Streptomyces hazeniae TaxID=3075538 RepID=A0ABU2NZA4_9ACTN|nr:hypothetical protein [Streptomyces sp. DSM 42041]MDT0382320.1 hypothetical protein [Streptomyces sp. DSM 42041]
MHSSRTSDPPGVVRPTPHDHREPTLTTTPSDPTGNFRHALLLQQLTDELNATEDFDSAATLVDLVLEPGDGLLDTLADFFEAAGAKVRESEHDDAFDLEAELNAAATHTRSLGEDLHTATVRMRALTPPPAPPELPATLPAAPAPVPPRPATAHTR